LGDGGRGKDKKLNRLDEKITKYKLQNTNKSQNTNYNFQKRRSLSLLKHSGVPFSGNRGLFVKVEGSGEVTSPVIIETTANTL
jgi:hypothetical protein